MLLTSKRHGLALLSLERLESRLPLAAVLAITEIMPVNDGALADEDGDFSDWVEVHNSGDVAADLAGYSLTDNINRLDKWVFPSVTLEPGAYRVVFASSKDRSDPAGELHTNFRLDGDGEYLALVAPDGSTIVDEFAPYPEQIENISYGLPQDVTTSGGCWRGGASAGAGRRFTGATWTAADFDDAAWTPATTGVGFEADPVGQGRVLAYGNLAGAGGSQDYGGSLGHDFVVHAPILVTRLGVFDSGADGLALPLVAQLWSRTGNSGTKLAELSFNSASPGTLVGSNRMKDLATPLSLGPAITPSWDMATARPSETVTKGRADRSRPTSRSTRGAARFRSSGRGDTGRPGSFPRRPMAGRRTATAPGRSSSPRRPFRG